MTRSQTRASQVSADGAEAIICDALDAMALLDAVKAAEPEVVVHLLTALPPRFDLKSDFLAPTNRLRIEGTRNLVAAARAAGAKRLLAESVAFLYAPVGGWVKDEGAALAADAPAPFGAAVAALADLESQVMGAEGIDGVVLRYGWLYGPRTHFARSGSQAADVRRRRAPLVGNGGGTFSFIHVEDAASATLAAAIGGAPGIYNVVDDDPAPMREWLPFFATVLGAKRPRRVPSFIARLVAGPAAAAMATQMRGASNQKAKQGLDWAPRFQSWRQGFLEAAD